MVTAADAALRPAGPGLRPADAAPRPADAAPRPARRAVAPRTSLRELWQYRYLVPLMAKREFRLRFRQTRLGPIWLLLNTIVYSGAYAFIFGSVGRVKTGGVNEFSYTLVGMTVWSSFAAVFFSSRNFLLQNRDLVSQVYFPRASIPIGSYVAAQFDTVLSLGIMAVIMATSHVVPGWNLLLIPLWLLPAGILALALGTFVALLSVGFRDLQNIAAILVTFGPIITPIAYPASALPRNLHWIAKLNPLTPSVNGMRWSILHSTQPTWASVGLSAAFVGVVALAVVAVFKRTDGRVADAL